jgi:hypothetical protein
MESTTQTPTRQTDEQLVRSITEIRNLKRPDVRKANIAGIAAYLTTGGKLAPFELWFLNDYVMVQIIFGVWNNRNKLVKV